MSQGFYSGVSSLALQGRRLEISAQNIANATTTGFKRHMSVVHTEADSRGQVQQVARDAINFAQGELNRTERPLDLAITGEGFFAIESQTGEVYTRDGAFQLDSSGVLTTEEGAPVVWRTAAGRPDPLGAPIEVGPSGQVLQGGQELGSLKLVNFPDTNVLRPNADGSFRAPSGAATSTVTGEVHQGALESSNTTALDEMIEMIAIQRHFSQVTRAISSIQESYDRITNPR